MDDPEEAARLDRLAAQNPAAPAPAAESPVVDANGPVPMSLDPSFEGNDEIDDDDLKEVIKTKEFTILDRTKIQNDQRLLQKHYEEKGFYLAKVESEQRIKDGKKFECDVPSGHNSFIYILKGELKIGNANNK